MKYLQPILLFWLSVLFFLTGCDTSSQEDAVMQAMLNTQHKQVKKQSQKVFRMNTAFRSEYMLDQANHPEDRRALAKAEEVHNQVKRAVIAADTLIRYLEANRETSLNRTANSSINTDTKQQKLETAYNRALKNLKKKQLADKDSDIQALRYLNNLNGDYLAGKSGFARVQELRSQQLDLLKAEEILLQQQAQRIGAGGIRCYFGSGMMHVLSANILQPGQQASVLIGPSAQWRADEYNRGTIKPHLFRLNGKEQPFDRRNWIASDDPYFKIVGYPPPGFNAEINIPTSAEDLGQAESVMKTFTTEWLVPVSYFQDSVFTLQGQYEIRKKCN